MIAGAIIKGQKAVTVKVQASYKIAKGITWIRSVTGAHCRPRCPKKGDLEFLKNGWGMLVHRAGGGVQAEPVALSLPLPLAQEDTENPSPSPSWN
jgi:hypothetical protein